MRFPEIQKHMGEDVTVSALRWQFSIPIKADAQRLRDARAAGIDCQTVVLSGAGGSYKGGQSQTFPHSVFYLFPAHLYLPLEPT